ncbi:SP_1767 family glycosyltransferase [Neobacillus sp. OS1-33]|uniref:SP_1767 family glycosyltransferase n=1 Tax=Neobacillus sp. OS1-33 TaxID=3070683 RepID=UPI0027DFABE5|nr:SP_1767 family glycosyltransferase [Neobacillus sp. OS1-33]WML25159.1 SP_1767 family glycosyltransferase [Neobacillus sp. OS1-33]
MKKLLLKMYYIFLDLKNNFKVLRDKLNSVISKPPIVKTTDETLSKIINEKCSVSRYGNGEFNIMFKGEQFFQEYDYDLSLRLIEIISSQSKNHIVCIPDVFSNIDKFTDRAQNFWRKYLILNRSKIYRKLKKKKVYYDAMVTRLYMDYKDKSKSDERFSKFKMIWEDREIILVEGEQSRLGAGNNLFSNAKSLKRILCPAENAFAKYEEILTAVKKYDTSKLILLALGPTATVLAYDLSRMGYQAVDIGNVDIEYEWFLKRTQVKTPVKHKYTGEVANGTKVEKLHNPEYENEILVQIL